MTREEAIAHVKQYERLNNLGSPKATWYMDDLHDCWGISKSGLKYARLHGWLQGYVKRISGRWFVSRDNMITAIAEAHREAA